MAIFSAPLLAIGAGSIAGARLFQRTFGFKLAGSAIFLGGSGIRGGGALARRSAGFGAGGMGGAGAWLRTGSGFSDTAGGAGALPRTGSTLSRIIAGAGVLLRAGAGFSSITGGAGARCGLGSGSATIEGFFRLASIGAGSGSGFFGLREGVTVLVK